VVSPTGPVSRPPSMRTPPMSVSTYRGCRRSPLLPSPNRSCSQRYTSRGSPAGSCGNTSSQQVDLKFEKVSACGPLLVWISHLGARPAWPAARSKAHTDVVHLERDAY